MRCSHCGVIVRHTLCTSNPSLSNIFFEGTQKDEKMFGPYDTQDSRMVPHCSTNWAQQCLTSQFERDAVDSLWCDRKTLLRLFGRCCACARFCAMQPIPIFLVRFSPFPGAPKFSLTPRRERKMVLKCRLTKRAAHGRRRFPPAERIRVIVRKRSWA